MVCAVAGCDLPGDVTLHQCCNCKKEVHHVCSNKIHMGTLSEMFCSTQCVSEHSNEEVVHIDVPEDAQGAEKDKDERDEYGIPVRVKYARSVNGKHAVCEYIHVLHHPYTSNRVSRRKNASASVSTHVCLVCAKDILDRVTVGEFAWERALCNIANTSNATKHFVRLHKDKNLAMKSTERAVVRA